MFRCINACIAAAVLTAAVLPLDAAAQMYRCTSKDGRVYYGQTIPTPCIGEIVEQLNSQGLVIKRIMPTNVKPEDPALKAAEEKKKLEEAARAKEEARRNRALLATYTSVKEIDDARARALAEPTARVKEIDARVEELKKKRATLEKEKTSHKSSDNSPIPLAEQIRNVQSELDLQRELAASRRRDIDSINARYNEDKKRYLELTEGR